MRTGTVFYRQARSGNCLRLVLRNGLLLKIGRAMGDRFISYGQPNSSTQCWPQFFFPLTPAGKDGPCVPSVARAHRYKQTNRLNPILARKLAQIGRNELAHRAPDQFLVRVRDNGNQRIFTAPVDSELTRYGEPFMRSFRENSKYEKNAGQRNSTRRVACCVSGWTETL